MPRRLTIDDLAAVAVPEQPALSPDGTRIAYVLRTTSKPASAASRARPERVYRRWVCRASSCALRIHW